MTERRQDLLAGIDVLEAQRALLGDGVVDMSLAALRAELASLETNAAQTPGPVQTLKQVSILFLDVVGSTTLTQRLDPEEVSAVMDGALLRGTKLLAKHPREPRDRRAVGGRPGNSVVSATARSTRWRGRQRSPRPALMELEPVLQAAGTTGPPSKRQRQACRPAPETPAKWPSAAARGGCRRRENAG